MKPNFYAEEITFTNLKYVLPQTISNEITLGFIKCDLNIVLFGSGDFTKYVKGGTINKKKLFKDIDNGKIKIIFNK